MLDTLKICNLIANNIIEEFKKIDSNNVTEIYVTLHSKFFVVEGYTSINSPINISDISQSKLNDLFEEEELSGDIIPYNYIDLIDYNIPPRHSDVDYTKQFHKYLSYSSKISKIVTSDKVFGQSLSTDKPYYFLGEYIANHMFERNLCRDVKLRIQHDSLLDCSVDDVSFLIHSDTLITERGWCISLILDLFPFKHKEIIEHLELEEYNLENYILGNGNYPWLKRDKISEMVLV